jgi:predicted PhzF superfamily epimerase YddE/YHI9
VTVKIELLRVFPDAAGRHGNPLAVVLDGPAIPDPEDRQKLAAKLDLSETVFVDDPDQATLRIYTPTVELPFAGHPVVGTAWLLARELGRAVDTVRTRGGAVPTWTEADGAVWIRGLLAATPPWTHERLATAQQVADLTGPLDPGTQDATQIWAWLDEPGGLVRARLFAGRYGVAEDEACGSASLRLTAALGRALTVHHGEGSIIHTRPGPPGTAEIGGHVIRDGPVT